MANKIEARAPFLDNEFSELMLSIPSNIRTKKNDFKYLLRKTIKNIIPKENILNKKQGFVGLESQYFLKNKNLIYEELFQKENIDKQGIFNYNTLKNFFDFINWLKIFIFSRVLMFLNFIVFLIFHNCYIGS